MIEQRRLTKDELYELLRDAPDSETRNLKIFLIRNNIEAYDFFEKYGKDHFGLIVDGRPIYNAVLVENDNGLNEFWTTVNSNVSHNIISLCKYAKRELKKWVNKFGDIYATMERDRLENVKWTEWLGFKKIYEDNKLITFCIHNI